MTLPIPTEDVEQMAVVAYLETVGLKFSCIPNHTWTSSWKQKRHNKDLGLRPGLPDLLIVLPGKGLLFIEMKRIRNSHTSDEQQAWIELLNTLPGVAAHCCKGAEDAIVVIKGYLG